MTNNNKIVFQFFFICSNILWHFSLIRMCAYIHGKKEKKKKNSRRFLRQTSFQYFFFILIFFFLVVKNRRELDYDDQNQKNELKNVIRKRLVYHIRNELYLLVSLTSQRPYLVFQNRIRPLSPLLFPHGPGNRVPNR